MTMMDTQDQAQPTSPTSVGRASSPPSSSLPASLSACTANASSKQHHQDAHVIEEDDTYVRTKSNGKEVEATMTSPTSVVAMVSSASSASLLPSAATSCASLNTMMKDSKDTVVVAKPFFVMDWLEEINPRDLELARQMILQTPEKAKRQQQQQKSMVIETPLSAGTSSDCLSTTSFNDSKPDRSSIALPSLIPNDDNSSISKEDSSRNDNSHSAASDVCRRIFAAE